MKKMGLDPVKQDSLVEMVAQKIRDFILLNNLKSGDLLPTEGYLMEHLLVSRSTIREALSLLKTSGLLESKRGMGTVIKEFNFKDTAKQLTFGIQLHAKNTSLKVLFEARYILEMALAPYIVQRITEAELHDLEILTEAYAQALEPSERFYLDACFHNKLLEAAHNEYLVNYGIVILDFASIKQHIFPTIFSSSGAITLEEHKRLLQHCKNHDIQAYLSEMEAHLNRLRLLFAPNTL